MSDNRDPEATYKALSPREDELIDLCVQGMTTDAIAQKLGLSVGTVNTYWLRIKLKVGGSGRTETVVRIVKERAERALREANVEREDLKALVVKQEADLAESQAALGLLTTALDQIDSTVWATDRDLRVQIISTGDFPATHFGVSWEVGKTVYDIFKTDDPEHPAIAAHHQALAGESIVLPLTGEFRDLCLRVSPLHDDDNPGLVVGCISILNVIEGTRTAEIDDVEDSC